jgi:HSP20 family protein
MSDKSAATATQMAPAAAPLKVADRETAIDRFNRIQQEIARRAFEMFENGGGLYGHDLDHWFKAEAELFHPVHINITEFDNALHIQAEVPGFNANELEVSAERDRLTIRGKRETTKEQEKKGKTVYQEHCSSELYRVITLPAEVDAAKTTATLKNGILELNLPKGTRAKTTRVEVKAA